MAVLRGSGPVTCSCGRHRERCLFGTQHSWSMAYVDHHTGRRMESPMLHCMTCDTYCALVEDLL